MHIYWRGGAEYQPFYQLLRCKPSTKAVANSPAVQRLLPTIGGRRQLGEMSAISRKCLRTFWDLIRIEELPNIVWTLGQVVNNTIEVFRTNVRDDSRFLPY